jgi:hypothetical protein
VSAGSGNQTEVVDTTTYADPWAVLVVDSNRNPVAGATVTASIRATAYRKGVWIYRTGTNAGFWDASGYESLPGSVSPPLRCSSEDLNNNNINDAGEDINGNNRLDPGAPASVQIVGDGKTGPDGRVRLNIVYPKSFGLWAFVQLRVTISTSGTESVWEFPEYLLPVVAADVTSQSTSPPNIRVRTPPFPNGDDFLTGAYGYVGSCTSPN